MGQSPAGGQALAGPSLWRPLVAPGSFKGVPPRPHLEHLQQKGQLGAPRAPRRDSLGGCLGLEQADTPETLHSDQDHLNLLLSSTNIWKPNQVAFFIERKD